MNTPTAVFRHVDKHGQWLLIAIPEAAFVPLVNVITLPLLLIADAAQFVYHTFADLDVLRQRAEAKQTAKLAHEQIAQERKEEDEKLALQATIEAEATLNFKIIEAPTEAVLLAEVSRLMASGWRRAGNLEHREWSEFVDNGTYEGTFTRIHHQFRQPMERIAPLPSPS